ncbi:MAG TPA: ABC transporter substrate-binding protein [Candidatus Acidoferrum sp.]
MRRGWLVAGILVLAAFCRSCGGPKTETLSLLVWEGYADPSFVRAFEDAHHCKVVASYMGSSDELVAKLRGGSAGNYDVISPSSDVATSIVRARLAAPLDLAKIPTYPQLSARLRDSPLVKANGQTYGVPFVWGPNPLLYDTTAFAKAPDSWSVLWDSKFKGKISLWDELSSIYMAAQVLGYDKPDPNQLYNLSDEQLEAVKKKLIELKPNVRKYWSTGGELTNLFQNHEVIAAMGWPLMTVELRKLNYPIGETIPKENTTGWIDHLMITAASSHKELAQAFLEYMVEPQTQKLVTDVTHYTPANPGTAQLLTPDAVKSLHLDDPDAYMKRIYFWQDVPRRPKYTEIWNEVKNAQ